MSLCLILEAVHSDRLRCLIGCYLCLYLLSNHMRVILCVSLLCIHWLPVSPLTSSLKRLKNDCWIHCDANYAMHVHVYINTHTHTHALITTYLMLLEWICFECLLSHVMCLIDLAFAHIRLWLIGIDMCWSAYLGCSADPSDIVQCWSRLSLSTKRNRFVCVTLEQAWNIVCSELQLVVEQKFDKHLAEQLD